MGGAQCLTHPYIGQIMSIALKRDYNIYVSKAAEGSADNTNTVQLLVHDFSFNRSANLDSVGRETLSSTQVRTVAPHISIINPVTFTFNTYMLPLVDTNVTSPDEYLWTSLLGADVIGSTPYSTPTTSTIDFSEGNVGSLYELTLWFDNPNNADGSYRIDNAIIDSATLNIDINGIASIAWEGRGLSITRDSTPPTATDRTTATDYIKNRLSTLSMYLGTVYTVALTGGSIDINNNVEFYNRTQLGKTTAPQGHYTGNRNISGILSLYLKQGTNLSGDLYNDILSNASTDTYETTYEADITINIGGTTAPYVQVNIPRAILNIPQIQFNETLSMDVSFVAQEGSSFYTTIIYNA